ncbi:LacI family DNA-binding transcriptional regulator [Fictibacillus nanhaiensis]|uniref:LacI family DNA-binding transcriptional regulator n=1 Tax=Fictibacillus nanhaiensis TaxID=742169 RepID=UPI00203E5A20|nr:LacI family DNA-binding transcriptional regulator [Fictibacillus nanhaiensis]MCM3733128.1 LacI family DNA-binding transcriptional regulator [Fictibacillus nanhaiensis]
MANIKDIAKMAGVSVTTVSRVINNYPYVSAEKAEAVRLAMKKCNYQRNINAVHLSKGKTYLIGVVVPFSNHPYFGLLIEGIANAALKNNYKLVLIQTNYEKDKEIEALTMLKDKQIDALIVCSRICEWSVMEDYIEYGPIILCEDARGKTVASTFVDHYKSFTAALNYLYQKGHTRIGYCIGRRSGTNSEQRDAAYKDFLEENALSYNSDFIFSGCFNFEDGEKVVAKLIQQKSRPTALLVTSDQVAAGILTCCKEQGIFIPEDLAIMGFDNQPISQVMHITTLEIPLVEVGKKLFHQAMDGENVSHEEIPVKLIERETV